MAKAVYLSELVATVAGALIAGTVVTLAALVAWGGILHSGVTS